MALVIIDRNDLDTPLSDAEIAALALRRAPAAHDVVVVMLATADILDPDWPRGSLAKAEPLAANPRMAAEGVECIDDAIASVPPPEDSSRRPLAETPARRRSAQPGTGRKRVKRAA